jgi:hypothetical protein
VCHANTPCHPALDYSPCPGFQLRVRVLFLLHPFYFYTVESERASVKPRSENAATPLTAHAWRTRFYTERIETSAVQDER